MEFAGGVQVTDFLGPLCSSDSAEAAATSLVTWFASIGEHTSLDARNMLPESGFPAALAVAAEDMGLMSRMADDELTVRLALPTSWEAYLDGLEKKHRHELLRKQRRYEAAVGKPSARVASAGTLNRDFATFTTLMHNARGAKRAFLTPPVVAFWWTLLHDPQDSVGARLHLLEADGRCLAATFGFNIGARYFLYNSVYDSTRGDLSPGLVLLGWLIQDAIERGAVVFDFLRGAERYKFDLGGAAHPLVRVRVAAR